MPPSDLTPPTGGRQGLPRRLPGRRWWATFALGNLSGLLVAALLVSLLPISERPESPLVEDLEPGELVILSGRDESPGEQRNRLIELWNDQHPRNKARIKPLNEDSAGQYAEMTNVARVDPEIDVFNLDVPWTAEFADEGLLRPIDESRLREAPDEVFLANPLSTCRHRDTLWALPFNTDAGLLFYRTDLGLRPPFDSWSKMVAESVRVLGTRPPGSPLEAGYTGQFESEGLTVNALEALWSAGGELEIDADKVSVDQDKWTAALRQLIPRRGNDDRPPVMHPDALSHNEIRSREAFRAGKVAFMRNWPVAYRLLSGTDASPAPSAGSSTRAAVSFDVAALPESSALGGQNLAIAKQTRQPRAAQALVEFLTGAWSQRTLFRGGFAATRAATYDDETVKREIPYADTLRDAVNRARLRPVSRYYQAFSLVVQREVAKVLNQGRDLPEDLDQRLTEALKRGRTPD